MINKILLRGDNSSLIDNLLKTLANYSNSTVFNFERAVEEPIKALSADQVLVNLLTNSTISQELTTSISDSTCTYATASPNLQNIESLKSVKFLAVQRHLTSIHYNNNLNLGKLKNNIALAEPSIRDSIYFILDLNVLRASEVSNEEFSFPSGLFSEDATQLFRYAGMNENNKEVIILNATESNVHLLAQFIWYYAEASSRRFSDHPYFSNTVNEYIVNVDSLDLSISFYKSKSSGRWWVKIPDIPENKWKSCSYEDYQNACEDDLSPELLEIISTV